MFKNKGNYPYPVLFETPVDFKTSKIVAKYSYKSYKDGHGIKVKCEINNAYIKQLIKDKVVCYALQIESPNAFFRQMYEFYDENSIEIKLSNMEVIDTLDIGFALLAKKDIESYYCEDFLDIYKDIKMIVHKNELIGVCTNVKIPIISKQEVLKEVTTIFNLEENDEAKHISYNTNRNRITVTLPKDIGTFYKKSKGTQNQIVVLNSLILVPVLSSVLTDMSNATDDDGINGKLWYKTLYAKVKELAEKQGKETVELLDDAFNTAQILMKDMLVNAVRVFETYVDESYDYDMDGKGDED